MVIHEVGNMRKGTWQVEKLEEKHFVVYFKSHEPYSMWESVGTYKNELSALKKAEQLAKKD